MNDPERIEDRMLRSFVTTSLIIAATHFGLLVLALFLSFSIFSGPTTSWEIFWERAGEVLLYPLFPILQEITDRTGQSIVAGINSILWGCIGAFLFLRWKARRAGRT
jgi:hypothetical protein